jgi:excinuclease UvrABC ATPase subunit
VHRARVKLAIQMATDSGIHVLDEPTGGLHLAEYVGTGASIADRRS